MGDKVSSRSLADLVSGRPAPADKLVGAARAAIGQGIGMGWGDEGEAWIREKLGQGKYEDLVKKIRQEYGQYSAENPKASTALEFGGGVAPGVVAMMIPGGQAAGAAQLGRSTAGALARLAAQSAGIGAIAGAGSAEDGNTLSGMGTGALIGGTLGAAIPVAMRGTSGAAKWLRERLAPSEALIADRASGKMTGALNSAGITPAEIESMMAADRGMKVPSVVANSNPALADLAEAVAQRAGRGAKTVEDTLTKQKVGSRERTYQQTTKALQPGDYYADEQNLVKELRDKAGTLYDDAYAHGSVDDPRINEVLGNPSFKSFYEKAKGIANTEAQAAKLRGEDPSKYALAEIYKPTMDEAGNVIGQELVKLPDVRTLDYIKRGIDAAIDQGYKSANGMTVADATALKGLRKEFVNAIDENVPKYADARKAYSGDMEVIDAMRTGMNDFGKMDHEQVIKMVSGMGDAEKAALRTGVARGLYSKIMDPSGNFNAAQRIIGSPEAQAKLQPLFDDPGQFKLFRAAMERESQMFGEANRILGNSRTTKRREMVDALDQDSGVGDAIAHAVTGGWPSSLMGMVSGALRSGTMTEKTAAKLADMLMAKDPAQVAAVVKTLEDYAAKSAPKAVRASQMEAGAGSGAAVAIQPAPLPMDEQQRNIEDVSNIMPSVPERDIEADIEAANKPR